MFPLLAAQITAIGAELASGQWEGEERVVTKMWSCLCLCPSTTKTNTTWHTVLFFGVFFHWQPRPRCLLCKSLGDAFSEFQSWPLAPFPGGANTSQVLWPFSWRGQWNQYSQPCWHCHTTQESFVRSLLWCCDRGRCGSLTGWNLPSVVTHWVPLWVYIVSTPLGGGGLPSEAPLLGPYSDDCMF